MITNQDILDCLDSMEYFKDKEIDFEISLAISDFVRKLQPLARDINDLRDKIGRSYAELDKDGNPIILQGNNGEIMISIIRDKREECYGKVEKLMEAENKNAPKILKSYFVGMKIPPGVVNAIRPFLDMDN